MFESTPAIEESGAKQTARKVARSMPAITVGFVFIIIGYTKLDGSPTSEWVRVFDRIGLGQWFRIVTGVVQMVGGLLFMPSRSRTAGAILLASTMVGAALVDLVILHSPLVIAPLLLLFLLGAIWAIGS